MNLKRNNKSDYSRSVVKAILTNVSHAYVGFLGIDELPNKKVFELPEYLDDNGETNRFSVDIAPDVLNKGFESDKLLPSDVIYDGKYIGVDGITNDSLIVTVRKAKLQSRNPSLETLEYIWESKTVEE